MNNETTQITLNNLKLELASVQGLESDMKKATESDETTITTFKKLQMEHQYKLGRLNESIQKFLMDEGLAGETHLLTVCEHFFNKGKKTITIAS